MRHSNGSRLGLVDRSRRVIGVVGVVGALGLGTALLAPVVGAWDYSVSTLSYSATGMPTSSNPGKQSADLTAGQYAYDTATMTEPTTGYYVLPGSVTFGLYAGGAAYDQACSSGGSRAVTSGLTPLFTATVPVAGEKASGSLTETVSSLNVATGAGAFQVPAGTTSTTTYFWIATYNSQQPNNGPVIVDMSSCTSEELWVVSPPPTVVTTPSPTTTTVGQPLSDSASVTNPVTAWPSSDGGGPWIQFWLNGPNDPTCQAGSALFSSGEIPYSATTGTVNFTPSNTYPVTDLTVTPSQTLKSWNPNWDSAPGTYRWVVDYYYWDTQTQKMVLFEGNCNAEEVTVASPPPSQNTPSITTQLSAISASSPATVTDSATLSGASGSASGAITINVYRGSTAESCTTANLVATHAAAPDTSGNGVYKATFSGLTAGNYEFQASFAGDTADSSAHSACGSEPFTVSTTTPPPGPPSQNTPGITTQLSAISASSPATVTDSATLSGASGSASGAITINVYRGSTAESCTTVNLVATHAAAPDTSGNGVYKATFSGLTAGNYEFQATFAGDSSDSSAQSACGSEPFTVSTTTPPRGRPPTPNTPSVTTIPSAGGPVGTVLSDTAQVTGIVNPVTTDTVTFGLYSNSSCTTLVDNLGSARVMGPTITNGVATWTASSPSPGYAPNIAATYYWGVTFNSVGDSANLSSSLVCGEPVTITSARGTLGVHTPPPTPPGAVKAASTPTPNTGANLFLPGMLAAIAMLMGGVLLLTGVRIRRSPTA